MLVDAVLDSAASLLNLQQSTARIMIFVLDYSSLCHILDGSAPPLIVCLAASFCFDANPGASFSAGNGFVQATGDHGVPQVPPF